MAETDVKKCKRMKSKIRENIDFLFVTNGHNVEVMTRALENIEALLKEVHDNVQGLEEDLLVKQIDEIKGACSGNIPDEEGKRDHEKMEADYSEDREGEGNKEIETEERPNNDGNVDNLEIILAEKMETLEDLKNMIELEPSIG